MKAILSAAYFYLALLIAIILLITGGTCKTSDFLDFYPLSPARGTEGKRGKLRAVLQVPQHCNLYDIG